MTTRTDAIKALIDRALEKQRPHLDRASGLTALTLVIRFAKQRQWPSVLLFRPEYSENPSREDD